MARFVSLLAGLVSVVAALTDEGTALAQKAPQAIPAVSQSACPDALSDVDRVACFVSLSPEAAPPRPKPPEPLLRGSDGKTIIGPNGQTTVVPDTR